MKYIKARVPDDIHAKLTAMAEADHRSLNSMLIVLIEEADRQRDTPAGRLSILTCHLCGDRVPVRDVANHVRLMHPDVDAWPEAWPDGEPVVVEEPAALADEDED